MNKTFVIITPGFPVNEEDTSCIPPQQVFVNALHQCHPSLNVIVISLQYPFLSKEYQWKGVKVISLGGKNYSNFYRILVWIKAWILLKKIRKENQVIGMLSFWLGECALIGKYFGKNYQIKHLCWILGQDARLKNRYFSLIKPIPEDLIALSDFIADELYNNYGVKPRYIIPVGIDRSLFEENISERDIDILGAGSLITLKQYDVFIWVIKEIKKQIPGIRVVLCGDGAERCKLQDLIEEFGLDKNIKQLGEIPHAEVLAIMQRSKVFLHTSSYEGFGAVCTEALYGGTYVVSFCKPMKEDFEKWFIVNSKEEMEKKTISLLKDEKKVEFKRVLTYTIEEVVEKMMRLFIDYPFSESLQNNKIEICCKME